MAKLWWFVLMIGVWRFSFADGGVTGTLTYSIHHERFGHIGTHIVTIRGDEDAQVVEVATDLSIPVLFFTYSEAVRQTETWHRGRLVSFRRTSTKGDALEVAAWASGKRLVVEGPSGRTELPGDVLSSHPWNPRLLDQSRIMLAETGELAPVHITAQGKDTVLAGGELIPVRKYAITGGLSRELWYDAHGLCVQVRLRKRGGVVTITLQTPDESHEMAALRSALKTLRSELSEIDS